MKNWAIPRILAGAVALALAGQPVTAAEGGDVEPEQLQQLLGELAAQRAELERQGLLLKQQQDEILALKSAVGVGRTPSAGPAEQASGMSTAPAGAVASVPVADSRVEQAERVDAGVEISGYASLAYFNRDWETDEFAKDSLDTQRLVVELERQLSERFSVTAEIEFEHGGTGVTMEFDSQEEFGEFEQSVEKGGEVVIEELYVAYEHAKWLNGRLGRFYVPVGRTNKWHKPQDYYTVARSEADAAMIPLTWHEVGMSLYGSYSFSDWGTVRYETQIVSGLDSTGFSSRNWIAGGHQQRFEQVVAEDLAFVARLDYWPITWLQVGGAYYGGNTTSNRPKNDLTYDAFVDLFEFDAQWAPGNFVLRGQYMWGRLQNSHLVTEANRNLSNNLGVKRTPVGSESLSWYLEAGYDLLPRTDQTLILFGRYDFYDSMYRTEGLVFDNPRWERTSWTVGLNYLPIPEVVLKAEYNDRSLGLEHNDSEKTFALGVSFTY
jgi:hypothetical protein